MDGLRAFVERVVAMGDHFAERVDGVAQQAVGGVEEQRLVVVRVGRAGSAAGGVVGVCEAVVGP